ncbi:hypothetical protein [Pseudomonas sp. BAY1663]|uniref:hypothetical protein n=1 Tax=Pseudomonas sp. BAY1663 TaxID=1439940 RepID=UPI000FFC0567|nr:hypothetical protein [Pseudomonas sp. BAY1663]
MQTTHSRQRPIMEQPGQRSKGQWLQPVAASPRSAMDVDLRGQTHPEIAASLPARPMPLTDG